MELLQLNYFRVVARLEHMTKAASELHVAQPALSMMITRLENDLGVPLFDRQGRNIKLNAYGKAFLQKTETALAALDEGRREVEDMAGLDKGLVSLSTSSLFRFNELLSRFLQLHPHVNFRISQSLTDGERIQLLLRNEIDFCLASPPVVQPGIAGMHLLTEQFYLGIPPGHRLADRSSIRLEEAANESFISLRAGSSARTMQEGFCREAGFQPIVTCEVDEPAAVSGLVGSGLGVAFFPAPAKSLIGDKIVFLQIEEPLCERSLQLSWNEQRYLSRAAIAFKAFAADYFSGPN